MIQSPAILLVLVCAAPGFAQPLEFEAASVKPSNADPGSFGWHSRTGYLVMKNQTLAGLVGIAYGVSPESVSGGPKWIASDRFDVEARAAGPARDPELLLMLRSMLAERFQLAVHRETRSTSGFSLTPAKGGLKLRPDETAGKSAWNSTRGKIVAQRITLAKLAESLTRILGAPVTDMTAKDGVFSFTIEWTPDAPRPAANAAAVDSPLPEAPSGPSIFTVLQQELGLKLESRKVPVEAIVVDRAEKPIEN